MICFVRKKFVQSIVRVVEYVRKKVISTCISSEILKAGLLLL